MTEGSPAAAPTSTGPASPRPFSVIARDERTQARAGVLSTPHGEVETPVFMPVATQASVKALSQEDLASLGARIILANAYHLYLRPGARTLEKLGGLHRFMNYPGAILTDSGGFQVMSLAPLRKVADEGVRFRSHLDGSEHLLTPEGVIAVQRSLGSDIWTSLDECVKYPCDEGAARTALERTLRWTERARDAYRRAMDSLRPSLPARGERETAETLSPSGGGGRGEGALFFPIIQGSFFPALRRRAAEHLAGIDHHGVSIGGISVGEPKPLTWETVSTTCRMLAEDKPRYLMGVGTPEDLWDAVGHGVDMMDCVWPTRVARHGMAMVHSGRLNLMNSAHREDPGPLDPDCPCRVCRSCSRAYLSHLVRAGELSAMSLVSYHNVHFLLETMRVIRDSILKGRFPEARKAFFSKYSTAPRPEGSRKSGRNMLKSGNL